MMSEKKINEEKDNLLPFLPSNLLSELEEGFNTSSKNAHKESNFSNF